eukprot:m.167896 g.167896  ORF g.167896 m.167896 type:complete len:146 (+) comp38941_c0_seq35:1104-1541(+)
MMAYSLFLFAIGRLRCPLTLKRAPNQMWLRNTASKGAEKSSEMTGGSKATKESTAELRYDVIASTIAQQRPDIVLLQENKLNATNTLKKFVGDDERREWSAVSWRGDASIMWRNDKLEKSLQTSIHPDYKLSYYNPNPKRLSFWS